MQMPGMKVTLDAAMRARDVSRPHAEHEALADAGETAPARAIETRDHGQSAPQGAASEVGAPAAGMGGTPRGGRSPRRRRRRR
jgi:hypothetical protein